MLARARQPSASAAGGDDGACGSGNRCRVLGGWFEVFKDNQRDLQIASKHNNRKLKDAVR